MEEQNIPVPAESLRTIASASSDEVHDLREEGLYNRAEQTEEAIAEAFAALQGRHGEFVSVNASTVSRLAAAAVSAAPSSDETVWNHSDAAEVFLRKYGVWS